MEANKRSISDVFNRSRVLEIPFFQRAYVWNVNNWERFFEDMKMVSDTKRPYFVGSLILKQKPTPTGDENGDVRMLIDGQQRLTTIAIFFKVASLKTGENRWLNRFKLDKDDKTLSLIHNRYDREAFERIMHCEKAENINLHDKVTQAYNYLLKRVGEEEINFENVMNNLTFVTIDLNPEEDEQQIFDTLNSLGVTLTTGELLKNYFFSRNNLDEYKVYWEDVFEQDDDTRRFWDTQATAGRSFRAFIDWFFYAFLQIKMQSLGTEINASDRIAFSRVDGLFESYKKLVKNYLNGDKLALVKEISEYALIFKKYFTPECLNSFLPPTASFERINAIIFGIETSTLLPYALYILKEVYDENDRNTLFGAIESYIMRRIVCRETSANYNKFFAQLIGAKINSAVKFMDYLSKQEDTDNRMPTDAELKNGFKNKKLINKQATGVLYMLESKVRDSKKNATALLGLSNYSLEHIMPKKWESMWGTLNNSEDKEYRNRKLLTLGNLSILPGSLNTSIKNGSWETKLNGRNKLPGLRQYAAGLETISIFFDRKSWDENVIDERADYLSKEAINAWPKEFLFSHE